MATNNRAELRAAIAALRLSDWRDSFLNVVIATDSTYVMSGDTKSTRGWVRNGWKASTGSDVKNRDPWEALLGEVERWREQGLFIKFWKIPREMNTEADRAAKEVLREKSVYGWTDVCIDGS